MVRIILLLSLTTAWAQTSIIGDILRPFLERQPEQAMAMNIDLEWDREMRVIARYTSQLRPGPFNQEVLYPLQQLYLEERQFRPAILKLMQTIELETAEELRADKSRSWYGDLIDGTTALAGLYVLGHSVGTAVSKTQTFAKIRASTCFGKLEHLFSKGKSPFRSRSIVESNDEARGVAKYHGPLERVREERAFEGWLRNKWNSSKPLILGLGVSSGAGLLWGGGKAIHHHLADRKLSAQQVLNWANRYLALRHSFVACQNYVKAQELRAQMETTDVLSEATRQEWQSTLWEWQEQQQQMSREIQELNALAPEFREGITVDFSDPQAPAAGSIGRDLWQPTEQQQSCQLKAERFILSTAPISWHLQRTQEVLIPLYERYLPLGNPL